MNDFQKITADLGIEHLPEQLQEQFLADAGTLALKHALQKTLVMIDTERQDALSERIEESNAHKDDEKKRRAVWEYVRANVPEFVPVLQKEARALRERLVEVRENREAEE